MSFKFSCVFWTCILQVFVVDCARNSKFPISVYGLLTCERIRAYGTVLGLFEGIDDHRMERHYLRISQWTMVGHSGEFHLKGMLHSRAHNVYLNITHQCVPPKKWKLYHNCYMNVRIPLYLNFEDTANFTKDLSRKQFQLSHPKCVLWEYDAPPDAYKHHIRTRHHTNN
ncbi:hypothetical protein Tcan_06774 [Toxocara canis]|uniref:Transthyretin-like protein 46 n=1 Tax=Toxocara canis TaxID=6265 RepID=A0A0B2VP24_TOXCA|nr:hypothetical protein Tcan_06774 [Toxocara canis]